LDIPVSKPLIEKEEIAAAIEALRAGYLGMGLFVEQFESELAQFLNLENRHLSLVSTGTAALHLGLIAAGVEPGDEVITPSLNYVAGLQSILAVNGVPVFCDIDKDTLCIDLDKAEELITDKTKAIMIMDYSGNICDYEKVDNLSARYGIRVVHDAAHSFGSTYKGKRIGSFSDICIFSFDPVKTITSIDGGALVVKSEQERLRISGLRQLGVTSSPNVNFWKGKVVDDDIIGRGFRYHMPNIHAAIGSQQLKKIDRIIRCRRKASEYYNERLRDLDEVNAPVADFNKIVPFLYYIRVNRLKREEFRTHLRANGISSGLHWRLNHTLTLGKEFRRGPLEVAEHVGSEIVTIPLFTEITRTEQDYIIQKTIEFFR